MDQRTLEHFSYEDAYKGEGKKMPGKIGKEYEYGEMKKEVDVEPRVKCAIEACKNYKGQGMFNGPVCSPCYKNWYFPTDKKVKDYGEERVILAGILREWLGITTLHHTEVEDSLELRTKSWIKMLEKEERAKAILKVADKLAELGVGKKIIDEIRQEAKEA